MNHQNKLESFLLDCIADSEAAIILADEEYFHSAWTFLEFNQIISCKLPTIIILLSNFQLPAEYAGFLSESAQVFSDKLLAVEAICTSFGTKSFPGAGKQLSRFKHAKTFDLDFAIPNWLIQDIEKENYWFSDQGDSVWTRIKPILGTNDATEIIQGIEKQIHGHIGKSYDFFENKLWSLLERFSNEGGDELIPIGYHKFPIPGLNTTAIGLSIQSERYGGFCRYISMVIPFRSIELQMVFFVPGSLQRFHALLPDLNEIILTLSDPKINSNYKQLNNNIGNDNYTDPPELLWARCSSCFKRVYFRELATGLCSDCGGTFLECMTVHCKARMGMSFSELRIEIDRIRQFLPEPIDQLGALCPGCLANLFLPSWIIKKMHQKAELSLPHKWSPITLSLLVFLGLCATNMHWKQNFVLRFFLFYSAFSPIYYAIRSIGPIKHGVRIGYFFSGLVLLTSVMCIVLLATDTFYHHDLLNFHKMLGLVGSSAAFCLSLSCIVVISRYRVKHTILTSIGLSLYWLFLILEFKSMLSVSLDPIVLAVLGIPLSALFFSIAILTCKRFGGTFSPTQLWNLGD